ncbi:MAG: hypothetical protein ACKKMO_01710 [Candidatus Nealsonbacteria bacterium]
MKLLVKNLAIIVVGLILPVSVWAIPATPHQFYGTVNFENGPALDGLLVEAKIDNVVVGNTLTNDGKYGYGSIFYIIDPDSDRDGKIIKFYVSGINSGETYIFNNGASTNLDLTVPGTIGTIEETDEDAVIENKTIPVAPTQPTNIKLGTNLSVTISSITNTNATIEKIEKLSSGNVAVFSGKNFLNAYEIKITGESLNISVTINYDDTGIDEDTVAPYWFNGTTWVEITDSVVDKNANTITFTIPSGSTIYAVFGSEPEPEPEPTPPSPPAGGGGATYTDTTPPSISTVNAVVGDTTATITWQTNELSISWIVFGETTTYGEEAKTTTYTTSHSVTLNDLLPETTYHYQIKSKDVSGNTGSYADKTFITLALGEAVTGDTNNDNKVDIFDFNLLMVNWGDAPDNIAADLDGNGKVDIFDFNLLMVNWTG